MNDLFGKPVPAPPDRALTPKERRKLLYGQISTVPKGHAAPPGTGPAGETCRSCRHYTHRKFAGTYRKCGLMKAHWTGGGGSDVRAKDPACKMWQAPE